MKTATLARLESLLQARRLDTTLRRFDAAPGPLAITTGVAAVDRVLGGGWRRGEVSEIVGPRSSGRTSLLLSTCAAATAGGGLVGFVDAVDRFDPVGAAEAGVDLDRVLWVRGPSLTVESARPDVVGQAVHRALRALDLIVRAGGFAVAVLDVADVPARGLRTLPWTTWLRLAHANEGRDTVCLLAGETAMGRSARGVSLALAPAPRWSGTSVQSRRFDGFDLASAADRQAAWRSRA